MSNNELENLVKAFNKSAYKKVANLEVNKNRIEIRNRATNAIHPFWDGAMHKNIGDSQKIFFWDLVRQK